MTIGNNITDWKTYKGQGAWDFTVQPDKLTYNEGESISSVSSPVWKQLDARDASLVTNTHNPACGYWYKAYTPPPAGAIPDIYIEMHNMGLWQPDSAGDTTPEEMYRTINTSDYDGNVEYYWEVILNRCYKGAGTVDPYTIYLVDADNPTVPLTSLSFDSTSSEALLTYFQRKRIVFTPPAGSTTFAVKIPQFVSSGAGDWVEIGAIRIIVRQSSGATKTRVQIPLQCGNDWWKGSVLYSWEVSCTSYDDCREQYERWYYMGVWKYEASQFSTITSVDFEAVGGMPGSSTDSFYLALIDKTTNTLVPGSEHIWGPGDAVSRKTITLNPSFLTDGHEYEMRFKVTGPTGDSGELGMEGNLYLTINPITNVSSYIRVGRGEYQDYQGDDGVTGCSREAAASITIPDGYNVYFENSSVAWGWPGDLYTEFPGLDLDAMSINDLYTWATIWTGSNYRADLLMYYALVDRGDENPVAIPDSRLWWTQSEASALDYDGGSATDTIRHRSGQLTLTSEHEYFIQEINLENYLFQTQAFIIIAPQEV